MSRKKEDGDSIVSGNAGTRHFQPVAGRHLQRQKAKPGQFLSIYTNDGSKASSKTDQYL